MSSSGNMGSQFATKRKQLAHHRSSLPRETVGLASPTKRVLQLQRILGNQRLLRLLESEQLGATQSDPKATSEEPGQLERDPGEAENRTGIPGALRAGLESLSGLDFSGVRVHSNSSKPAQLNALAYTEGQDIHLGPGQEEHLPHEGWHVAQQMRGRVAPTIQTKGVSINDDAGLEREANVMGARVQQVAKRNQPLPGFSPALHGPTVVQRVCEIESALSFYQTTKAGKRIQFTTGLIEELYKVAGEQASGLRSQALAEGVIGESFVWLVCAVQRFLEIDDDGKLGPGTIKALDHWKTGGKKGIDYRELFKDTKLEIGIAVGAERHSRVAKIETFLLARGFLKSGDEHKPVYKKKKMYPVPGDRTAPPVEIEIIIEMISEKTTTPKEEFGSFLTDKEITFYSGHARYGTGPDFDAKSSPAENFVIGVQSALHAQGKVKKGYKNEMNKVLEDRKNDLEELSEAGKFDPDLYQVWFMDACSTINYLDEIRGGLVKGKGRDNLRIFGTTDLIYGDPLPIVEGILDMKTMEEIIAMKQESQEALKKAQGKDTDKSFYFSD